MYNPRVFFETPFYKFFLSFFSNLLWLEYTFPSFFQSDVLLLRTVQFDSQLKNPLPWDWAFFWSFEPSSCPRPGQKWFSLTTNWPTLGETKGNIFHPAEQGRKKKYISWMFSSLVTGNLNCGKPIGHKFGGLGFFRFPPLLPFPTRVSIDQKHVPLKICRLTATKSLITLGHWAS